MQHYKKIVANELKPNQLFYKKAGTLPGKEHRAYNNDTLLMCRMIPDKTGSLKSIVLATQAEFCPLYNEIVYVERKPKMCKVINADVGRTLETFDTQDVLNVIKRYEGMGKWNTVGLDRDGDVILWKE